MFRKILNTHRFKTGSGRDQTEHEKIERLEQAEAELDSLKARASKAISFLDSRHQRNHWRESIEDMIQGTN